MAELFHKTFVDALTGANGFDSVGATNGTIEQSAGAGLNSTSGGVTCTRTANSPNVYGYIAQSLAGKSFLRTAWYVDLSSITIGTNTHNFRMYEFISADLLTFVGSIGLQLVSGALQFRHILMNDSSVLSTNNAALTGNPNWMEMRIQRSSSGGVADAESQVYAGGGDYAATGELVSTISGIVLYTNFEQNSHRLGIRSGGPSVGGSLIVDEWVMRDDDTPIIYGISQSSGISRGMKYALNRRRRKQQCW